MTRHWEEHGLGVVRCGRLRLTGSPWERRRGKVGTRVFFCTPRDEVCILASSASCLKVLRRVAVACYREGDGIRLDATSVALCLAQTFLRFCEKEWSLFLAPNSGTRSLGSSRRSGGVGG